MRTRNRILSALAATTLGTGALVAAGIHASAHASAATGTSESYSACRALDGMYEPSDDGWWCTHPAGQVMKEPSLEAACGVVSWAYFLDTGGLNGAISYHCTAPVAG